VPGVNTVFNCYPLQAPWFLCAVPFSVGIFAFDEIRKLLMRRNPTGWIWEHTYY